MKQVIFLSLVLSPLLLFISNEQVFANREKRAPFDSSIKQLPVDINDAAVNPKIYCGKSMPFCSPTLRPSTNFNADADADAIREALKGLGTKEKTIISILSRRGMIQRLTIAEAFAKKKYGNLLNHLRDDTRGKFQDTLTAFMTPLPVFLAKELRKIFVQKSESKALVEIICTIPNVPLKSLSSYYGKLFNKELVQSVKAYAMSNFQTLILLMLEGKREETPVDNAKAKEDAQTLHKGVKKWAADPAELNNILVTRSHIQIRQIFVEYKKVSGHEIEEDIRKEFPGQDGMIAIVRALKDKAEFLAERLDESMKYGGTKDRELIRVIVGRCEIDLEDIKKAYKARYKKTLESVVASEIGSDYRDFLLSLITSGKSLTAPPSGKAAPGKKGSGKEESE